jgi:hypothetical protein
MVCRATFLTVVIVVAVVVSAVSGAAFKPDYSISSITRSEGVLTGGTEDEWTGASVSDGGDDVDGDRLDGFVVNALLASSLFGSGGASNAGHAYVLYGMTGASAAANA